MTENNVIVRSAKHDVTIFGRKSNNQRTYRAKVRGCLRRLRLLCMTKDGLF